MLDLVVHQRSDYKLVTCQNLEIAVWQSAPRAGQLRALEATGATLRRRYEGGIGLLNVIEGGGLPDFSDEVRQQAVKLTAGTLYVVAAHLVLVGGMVGAATRAFLSTITLLGRPRAPTRTFDDPAHALAWMTPLLRAGEPSWTVTTVTEAYEKARGA